MNDYLLKKIKNKKISEYEFISKYNEIKRNIENDKDKKYLLYSLLDYQFQYFNIWWNDYKNFEFNVIATEKIIVNCSNYIDVWIKNESIKNMLYYTIYIQILLLDNIGFDNDKYLLWWDSDKFNYEMLSNKLCIDYKEYFNIWFNKERFNYKTSSKYLCQYCPDYFHIWFDKDKFDWSDIDNVRALIMYCSQYFHIWYFGNEEYFESEISMICKYLTKYFELYWNQKYINIVSHAVLCQYCSQYFHIWFDKDKFNYKSNSKELCMYCSQYFHIWFDEDKFNWKTLSYMFKYCLDYFEEWYIPNKILWDLYYEYFQKYCQEYKDIWVMDYMKWKIKGGKQYGL